MKRWVNFVNLAVVDATAAVTTMGSEAIRAHLEDAVTNMEDALESFLEEEEQEQEQQNGYADREAGKARD